MLIMRVCPHGAYLCKRNHTRCRYKNFRDIMLKRAKESVNALGFEYTPVTVDMGLLTKALEVQWS